MTGRYDDIINLPHHVSSKHPRMSMQDRAAQFAPFAALRGHGEAIREVCRYVDAKIELTEDDKVAIDKYLQLLKSSLAQHPQIAVTYFVQDPRKAGGIYQVMQGELKKVDEWSHCIVMTNGSSIAFEDILEISSDLLPIK